MKNDIWYLAQRWKVDNIHIEPNDKSLTLAPDCLAAGPPEPEPGSDVPAAPPLAALIVLVGDG